ncbi:MAG: hypothetical protein Q8P13_00875 [bacterium]|nr:hypothetical protein [bacterium]
MRALAVLGIFSLLVGVVLIAFLATNQLGQTSKAGGAKETVATAISIKNKANLKILATKLNLYFSENGVYPQTLKEIDSAGLDLTTFQYAFCSPNSVIIKTGNENTVLKNGDNFSLNQSANPNC